MTKELDAAPGDIRALKYRIHELEGEVMGYKRILDEQAAAQCIGKDPLCPCQDGDACHYEGEDAWPVPAQAPAPAYNRDAVVVNLMRLANIDKHLARDIADAAFGPVSHATPFAHEAADAIERLEAENAQLKAELASLREQKPVAWGMENNGLILDIICPDEHDSYEGEYLTPLYAAPGAIK